MQTGARSAFGAGVSNLDRSAIPAGASNLRAGAGITVEEYAYDYAGNRISKTTDGVTITYLLDTNAPLTQVLAELENGTLKTEYTLQTR